MLFLRCHNYVQHGSLVFPILRQRRAQQQPDCSGNRTRNSNRLLQVEFFSSPRFEYHLTCHNANEDLFLLAFELCCFTKCGKRETQGIKRYSLPPVRGSKAPVQYQYQLSLTWIIWTGGAPLPPHCLQSSIDGACECADVLMCCLSAGL